MVASVAARDRVVANAPAVAALVAVHETPVVSAAVAIQVLAVGITSAAVKDPVANALVVAHAQAAVLTSAGAVVAITLVVAADANYSRTKYIS